MFLWTGKTLALITHCYIRLNSLIVSTKRETCPIEYEHQLFVFTFIAVTWFLFLPLDHNLCLCITTIDSQTIKKISSLRCDLPNMTKRQDDNEILNQGSWLTHYFMLPISGMQWMLLKILGLLWYSFLFPIYSIWS